MLDEFKNINQNLPEDYFKSFQKNLNEKLSDEDMIDLASEASILSSISKDAGMTVPENYFEELSLFEIVSSKPAKLISLSTLMSRAAAIILILSFTFLLYQQFQIEEAIDDSLVAEYNYLSNELNTSESLFESIIADQDNFFEYELEEMEIEELIENNIESFDINELVELL